jgi:GNAT superfamily N-acetyltransferase
MTRLKENHLEDAAALVSYRYGVLLDERPLLPHRYQEVSSLLPFLRDIQESGPGVAALQDGRLVGFLSGWLMPSFKGKRSVYSPEWANAASLENSRYIYEEMYRHLAAEWVADRFVAHYISLFANDLKGIGAWHWMGFGLLSVDAIRGLHPIRGAGGPIEVRKAQPQDIEQVMQLTDGLRRHMKGSPAFFDAEKLDEDDLRGWLGASDKMIWLACIEEEPVSFLRIGPAKDDGCTIIFDEKTTSIYGAYTKETMRGKDVASALLDHACMSARASGYERFAVDFETANLLGSRFWLRHSFGPVCFSLFRTVDETIW